MIEHKDDAHRYLFVPCWMSMAWRRAQSYVACGRLSKRNTQEANILL
jgi:hypothetical protein